MKSRSLKFKILVLLGMPLVTVLGFTAYLLELNWTTYKNRTLDLESTSYLLQTSQLIHQVQIERGKSALFLNNNGSLEEVSIQRKNVDLRLTDLLDAAKGELLSQSLQSSAAELKNTLEGIRKQVDARAPAAEISGAFGNLINRMIQFEVKSSHESAIGNRVVGSILIDVAKEGTGKLRAGLTNVISANKAISAAQKVTLEANMATIFSNLNSPVLQATSKGSEQIEKLKGSAEWTAISETYRKVIEKSHEGNFEEDPKVFFKTITDFINNLGQIVNEELSIAADAIRIDQQRASGNIKVLSTSAGILILLICLMAIYIVRDVTSSINGSVENLKESSHHIADASQQLRHASQKISSSTSESAAALQETVAAVDEISSQVKANASNASKAAELSMTSKTMAENGEKEIRELIDAMRELSQYSGKIADIVGVIDDIAFQTNLLALNAAVEAARAGELGSGFAVVADAVRGLAQKSAIAAKEIKDLIDISVEKTRSGSKVADVSGSSLAMIVTSISGVTEAVREISVASQEQSQGLEQVNLAMNQLDQVTQSNATSAEETLASAETVAAQAASLSSLVNILNQVIVGQHKQ